MRAYVFIYLFLVLGNNLYGILFVFHELIQEDRLLNTSPMKKKAMKFRNFYLLNIDVEMHGEGKGRVRNVRLKKMLNQRYHFRNSCIIILCPKNEPNILWAHFDHQNTLENTPPGLLRRLKRNFTFSELQPTSKREALEVLKGIAFNAQPLSS